MSKLNSGAGIAALAIGHVAGMIDLVVLPLWINTLIDGFGYFPAQAGALPSLFLVGAVIASVILSRRFHKLNGRVLVPLGFWISAASFLAIVKTDIFAIHAALHLIAGLAVGTSLSLIHGTMGQTANPHRVFAIAGFGLGVFAIIFLGGVPQLMNGMGPQAFFFAIGGTMALAGLATALLLPTKETEVHALEDVRSLPKSVRYSIAGVMGMALVQGMVFSFLVQVGNDRGFGGQSIEIMLIVLGFVGLAPAVLAALLEKKLAAMTVAKIGPLVQAALALAIMSSTLFPGYAIPAVLFSSAMIFTHTFVFGFMAQNDTTGRAVSATPAILMAGTASGPFIGGALVQLSGYPAIGIAAVLIAIFSITMFKRADKAAESLA